MPVDFSTLRNRERQRAAAYLQSRSKVIAAIDEIYNREPCRNLQLRPDRPRLL